MVDFGQYVIHGLAFGAIYALVALGFNLIFKTTGVVNFAAGAMGMTVTMILWSALDRGLPLAVAWLIAMAAALAVGALTEAVFLRRIEASPALIQIVVTLGLLLTIEGAAGLVWSYEPKAVPTAVNGSAVAIGPWYTSPNDIFIVGLSLALAGGFYVIFERTRVGLAMRAVAQDREVAALMGVRSFRYVTAAWAVGVLMAGIGAILFAPSQGLSPTMMDNAAVYAFAAAVLGGFGSLAGAVVGGFLIGIFQNLIGGYLSTDLEVSLIFLLIVLVLYVRPEGLFGVAAKTRL
jgi:branched-chain amino acid transport system permease protein